MFALVLLQAPLVGFVVEVDAIGFAIVPAYDLKGFAG